MNKQEVIHLSLGAFVGTMLRLEIVGITSKYLIEGPIPIDIIDNFYGSFIIGFYNDKFKKDDNSLHLAISTGFCGCLTTFSSWIVGVIKLASINQMYDCALNLSIGTLIAYSGFKLGQTASIELFFPVNRRLLYLFAAKFVIFEVLFQQWILIGTAMLAPFGALTRYYISKLNTQNIPFGTFLCNLLAVILASAFAGKIQKQTHYLHHIMLLKGFCGSLSTVSTWIKELCNFKNMEVPIIYCWTSLLLCFYFGFFVYEYVML